MFHPWLKTSLLANSVIAISATSTNPRADDEHQDEYVPESAEGETALFEPRRFLIWGLLYEFATIPLAFLIAWIFSVDIGARWHTTWDGALFGLGATIPLFLLFLVLYLYPVGPLRTMYDFLHQALGDWLRQAGWYELAALAALAGIGEELLFRGVLEPLIGFWLSNVLFALMHSVTPFYVVMAFLASCYMSGVLHYSQNLLAPVITHGLYDFLALATLAYFVRREARGDRQKSK